jgi:hypothetical protein
MHRLDRFKELHADMLTRFERVLYDHSYEGPMPDEITDLLNVAMVLARRAYDAGYSDAC